VFQLCGWFQSVIDRPATPHRKMGIEPIEGILGCKAVSSNRQAGEQPWVARHARMGASSVTALRSRRRARCWEVEASALPRVADRGCQNPDRMGRLSQPKGAEGLRGVKAHVATDRSRTKLSRRKTASSTCSHDSERESGANRTRHAKPTVPDDATRANGLNSPASVEDMQRPNTP
jgi:hypothetical protein